MKKSAVKTGLVVIVLVAVVMWTLLNNYFRGNLTAEIPKQKLSETLAVVQPTEPVSSIQVTAPESRNVSKTFGVAKKAIAEMFEKGDAFSNSQYCRAQYQEFMRISDGGALRALLKKNPAAMNVRCFKLSYVKGVSPSSCLMDVPGNPSVGDALCDVFVTYYKYMLTDFLNPLEGDLKSIPDDVLRAKIRSQFVPRKDHSDQIMNALAEELLRRYPDELRTIKTYLQAKYLVPETDFSSTGSLYPVIQKAYKMAPHDKDIQQFVAYSVMMSDRGLFKLTELEFLKDDYYGYYFYAWFHWKNKTDFEKVKMHLTTGLNKSSKYKYKFEALMSQVTDKKTVFGQVGVFGLDLEPMPSWDSL